MDLRLGELFRPAQRMTRNFREADGPARRERPECLARYGKGAALLEDYRRHEFTTES